MSGAAALFLEPDELEEYLLPVPEENIFALILQMAELFILNLKGDHP